MQRTLIMTAFLVELCLPMNAWSQSADDIPMDARSIAMGEAGTAIADGPAATWWNPAALAVYNGAGFSVGGRRLMPDFADDLWVGNAAAAIGAHGFGVGAHFTYLSYGEQPSFVPNLVYHPFEYTLRLGAGLDILRFTPEINENIKLGLGGTVNITHLEIPPGLFSGASEGPTATAWDVDLAALLQIHLPVDIVSEDDYLGIRMGVRWENVGNQDIGFEGRQERATLGRAVHTGVALEGDLQEAQSWQLHGVVSFDAQVFVGEMSDRPSIYKLGFEFSPRLLGEGHTVFVAARAGHIKTKGATEGDTTLGGAFGVAFLAEAHDYTFTLELATLPQLLAVQELGTANRVSHFTFAGKMGF